MRRLSRSPAAAIIPAYNEVEGIGRVLRVLRQVSLLAEIIVVDDGSTDGTADEVRRHCAHDPRIRLIPHIRNQGKGQAIFTGWRTTRAMYLLTLDADLAGLTPEQVRDLILPVLQRQADMTLGLFRHGNWSTDHSHRITPWLTGQRCLRADLLKHVPLEAAAGYGFETAVTMAARQQKVRTLAVPLLGVSHPPCEYHRGFWQGVRTRARMYGQIARAWYVCTGWQGKVARLKDWTSLI